MEKLDCTAYLAPEGFIPQLKAELKNVFQGYDRLLLAKGPPQLTHWAQNIWYEPILLPIKSIGDAAKQLKNLGRNWALYSFSNHRRAHLIEQQLPPLNKKPHIFPSFLPKVSIGSWTLLDKDTLLVSAHCSSPFANGEPYFAEQAIGPPGRAYLKIWEALTYLNQWPQTGQKCLEVGASPGGWTWALGQLGCSIIAVDRSDLDLSIAAHPKVHFIKGNAFSMLPEKFDHLDWIFSDVICYPEKLYEWVMTWLTSGKCSRFVCTLKFQGNDHYSIIDKFAEIPNSKLIHLFHNKHELTWMLA